MFLVIERSCLQLGKRDERSVLHLLQRQLEENVISTPDFQVFVLISVTAAHHICIQNTEQQLDTNESSVMSFTRDE